VNSERQDNLFMMSMGEAEREKARIDKIKAYSRLSLLYAFILILNLHYHK